MDPADAAPFVSRLLRPGVADTAVIAASGASSALSLLVGLLLWTGWNRQERTGIPDAAYLAGGAALVGAVSAVAMLDGGLGSVLVLTLVAFAPYLALVLPPRWSWPSLAVILGALATIAAVAGPGPDLTGPTLALMVVAGFIGGRLPRRGQERAARRAVWTARTDGLTGLLNRRGFEAEVDHALGGRSGLPIALAVIDLNGFKQVNDTLGHAAGDELLAWVGSRLLRYTSSNAVVGRTGGDEFAILVRDLDAPAAEAAMRGLHAVLAERAGTSIGVAFRADGLATRSALMHEADAAMYAAKSDCSDRVKVRPVAEREWPAPTPAPALTFADLRQHGIDHRPLSLADPGWVAHGNLISLVTGTFVIAATWLEGGDGMWESWLRWSGLVWIVAVAAWGVVLARQPVIDPDRPPARLLLPALALAAIGTMDAALADGGVSAPVAGAFGLALLYLACVAAWPVVRVGIGLFVVCWLATVALSPADARWAAPFAASLLIASLALGLVARLTVEEATETERHLASHDPLTELLNRRAFSDLVTAAAPSPTAGLLAIDLDDFKGVNDRLGHAAGDALLVNVAETLRRTLGPAWSVGRTGGDEFLAFIADIDRASLAEARDALEHALDAVTGGSVGAARFTDDGTTLAEVTAAADRRSYASKATRRDASRPAA